MNISLPQIKFDSEGYLEELSQWTPELATLLAKEENIELSHAHWEILHAVRNFYNEFDHAPAMRVLVKYLAATLGPDKSHSIYLLTLFPDSPAKKACRIAGLPKPTNCL
ncbi:TusE/DsrC/DsvC family sulfur relay protein [Marinibactrum halimedae]|uniref:Sulfurtransferase n=1 Tax=Marinibactrum halimedae TaxID=1444977 RepID=A0AA37T806_9GAMM|nr:TusE/DsrC/DsvC family sulfur relay protein [Marinibactrum halimedae]MCD9460121.1 TusE/DsrC/DsvC family sulfur relay protein [Marinibactrum halimedae]GLS26522.1 sulfurtransferase [Marinibactrum halimedae]